MIPPFATIQWLAHDREEEIRKEVNEYRRYDEIIRAQRPTLPERFALALRSLADRLDPEDPCESELYAD